MQPSPSASSNPMSASPAPENVKRIPLPTIARTFFMLGILGFGGPAAHLAMMETELVTRRQWLSRQYFLDILAAINLVPGPNSTEMALHIGYSTGGFFGMLIAGAGFILPAVIASAVLAMIYVNYGTIPAIKGVLSGIQPIILVLILSAAYRLGMKAIDNLAMRIIFGVALLVALLQFIPLMALFGQSPFYIPELLLLSGTGIAYVLWQRWQQGKLGADAANLTHHAKIGFFMSPFVVTPHLIERIAPTLGDIFGRFFVIGATLFGSGYVLAAYMQRTFVEGTGWLTAQQLVDVLAIGQTTPGPLLSTSAAAGYVMTATAGDLWSGVPGATVAALGVFLPAFIVILLLGRVVPYVQRYKVVQDFLKGVNGGVIALLLITFLDLAYKTTYHAQKGIDGVAIGLIVVAFILLERFKWNAMMLTGLGVVIGVVRVMLNF